MLPEARRWGCPVGVGTLEGHRESWNRIGNTAPARVTTIPGEAPQLRGNGECERTILAFLIILQSANPPPFPPPGSQRTLGIVVCSTQPSAIQKRTEEGQEGNRFERNRHERPLSTICLPSRPSWLPTWQQRGKQMEKERGTFCHRAAVLPSRRKSPRGPLRSSGWVHGPATAPLPLP